MAVSKKKSTTYETTARHVWLAGLGLVSVTRKEATATAARVLTGLAALSRRVERGVAEVQDDVRRGIDGVRDGLEPTLVRLGGEVEARLAPVLVNMGLRPPARVQRKTRKPTARRPAHGASVRKPAPPVAGKARH